MEPKSLDSSSDVVDGWTGEAGAVSVGMTVRIRSISWERRVWKWYTDRKIVLSGKRPIDSASGAVMSELRNPKGEVVAWRCRRRVRDWWTRDRTEGD